MRGIDEFLATTEARWEGLARAQAAIRADAEERAIDRRWSSGSWGASAQPYYLERVGLPRLRLRRKQPADIEGLHEYGFDEQERCVLIRHHCYGQA